MSVIDILYTIFDASVRSSVRRDPESSVPLMNLISNKPFFYFKYPTFDFGQVCEALSRLRICHSTCTPARQILIGVHVDG